MTTATMNAALQQLDMDAYIELYELDTSPLFQMHGTQLAGGTVYRWTAGIIEVRGAGQIPGGAAQSTTLVTLDKVLPLLAWRSYQVVVALDPNGVTQPTAIASFAIVDGVTQLSLALPMTGTPQPGMAYTVFGTNPVTFRGNVYTPMPIEVSGYEWAARGTLPRPKLSISNIGGLAGALAISYGDMLGATVTRLRTLREFLDDGVNADPTSFCEPDIYIVDRKSAHNKNFVEFELAAALDQQGKKLPGRIMLRDTCNLSYRQYATDSTGVTQFIYGSCPYTGPAMFDNTNLATLSPTLDVCSLRQSGCTVRFGNDAKLPFSAFPGISIA
jgi:lambda family phage minor tail protein L